MSSLVDKNLKVPYEIGVFIVSQVPYLDSNVKGEPWAISHFEGGPNPYFNQMKQGLILEVLNCNHMPISIYTRYGQWNVLGSCSGSFAKVFEVVQKTLKLKKIDELSNKHSSFYAIQNWDKKDLEAPIKAERKEFISCEVASSAYEKFSDTLCAQTTPTAKL